MLKDNIERHAQIMRGGDGDVNIAQRGYPVELLLNLNSCAPLALCNIVRDRTQHLSPP